MYLFVFLLVFDYVVVLCLHSLCSLNVHSHILVQIAFWFSWFRCAQIFPFFPACSGRYRRIAIAIQRTLCPSNVSTCHTARPSLSAWGIWNLVNLTTSAEHRLVVVWECSHRVELGKGIPKVYYSGYRDVYVTGVCASSIYIAVCHESVCMSECVCVIVDFLLLSFKLISHISHPHPGSCWTFVLVHHLTLPFPRLVNIRTHDLNLPELAACSC
jgi:hypothetical protein